MKTVISRHSKIAVIALGTCLAGAFALVKAQQRPAADVAIASSDVGGVVTSMNGPEAGVWVIAETADLPTKFAKMVVTDERGRYVIPELPKANYNIWVRGHSLVDSPKEKVAPGQHRDLTAVWGYVDGSLQPPNTIQARIGIRCCKSPIKVYSLGPALTETASRRKSKRRKIGSIRSRIPANPAMLWVRRASAGSCA